MKTQITPKALIELGFRKRNSTHDYYLFLDGGHIEVYGDNVVDLISKRIDIGRLRTNATTMEDIKDLIRLFK